MRRVYWLALPIAIVACGRKETPTPSGTNVIEWTDAKGASGGTVRDIPIRLYARDFGPLDLVLQVRGSEAGPTHVTVRLVENPGHWKVTGSARPGPSGVALSFSLAREAPPSPPGARTNASFEDVVVGRSLALNELSSRPVGPCHLLPEAKMPGVCLP